MRHLLLLLVAALVTCSAPSPYVTTVGILRPGVTLAIEAWSATVNAYQPAQGQRRDSFTIAATAPRNATPPPPPHLRAEPLGVVVHAPGTLQTLMVRVPDRVNLVVESHNGDVNVTDITGNARVILRQGNVNIMLPGYAQAQVGAGNISVTMGATDWPGTLYFSTGRGDIVLRISAKAAFGVRLHTGHGVLFTDFALRGTSNGQSETIVGNVNGGSARQIDVETSAGAIRLLRLQPQP